MKSKIIYVDDEEVNVLLFKINFSVNYEVLTGYSGFDGLELLKNNPDVKVVISDMKMPGMNGIEFIKTARENRPDIKCYILTGFDITEEIQEAIDTNLIVQYFRKPFSMDEIMQAIDRSL